MKAEIEKQQENTRQELEKPFAQEQELAEKEARLSAVNALLNIDGKNSIPDLMDDTLDIEPPQRAAKDGLENSSETTRTASARIVMHEPL